MLASALSNLIPRAAKSATDDFWYYPVGQVASSGVTVTPDAALAVSTVYACLNLLSETIGSLPFRVYKLTGGTRKGRDLAEDHSFDNVLYNRPNRWQSPVEWVDLGMRHLMLRGNYYNRVWKDGAEIELEPLNPDRMRVEQLDSGVLRYWYKETPAAEAMPYLPDRIFHVRAKSTNGITGCSVLDSAKNAIGLGIAQETHGAALFKNGGLPAIVINRPATAPPWNKDGGLTNFRREWRRITGGAENAGNPPILHDGMTVQSLPISNSDLQWIESQKFSGEQICRFFRVPPWMVGLADPPRDSEQGTLPFLRYTLRYWCVLWESAADRQLLREDREYYTKLGLDEIQRAAMKERYEANNVAIQGGWKLPNEARYEEDLPPIEGGDVPRFPLNMQPAGGGPDWNEQGGPPGKGQPMRGDVPPDDEEDDPAATLADAFRPLLRDAAERIAAREINGLKARAAKADKDRAKWQTWLGGYYREHESYAAKTIEPIKQAWHAAGGVVQRDALMMGLAAGTEVLGDGDAPAILADWESNRAEQHYRALLNAFGIEEETDA